MKRNQTPNSIQKQKQKPNKINENFNIASLHVILSSLASTNNGYIKAFIQHKCIMAKLMDNS